MKNKLSESPSECGVLKYFLAISVIVNVALLSVLYAYEPQSEADKKAGMSTLLREIDGCKVYRDRDGGGVFYYTTCPPK